MHVSEWVVRIDKPTWFSIYRAKGMCSLRSRGSQKRTEQPNKHLSVQTNKRTTLDSQQIFNYFQLKSWSRTIVWLNQSDWLHFHRTFCIIQSLAQTVFNFLKYQIGREMNTKKKINAIIISGPIEHPFFLWDTHFLGFNFSFQHKKSLWMLLSGKMYFWLCLFFPSTCHRQWVCQSDSLFPLINLPSSFSVYHEHFMEMQSYFLHQFPWK